MNALVFKAPGMITDPGDAPYLPDIVSNLYYDLNANDIAVASGAVVDHWVAAGEAPEPNRTFATVNTGWSFPTLNDSGPGGNKQVQFNGGQQIQAIAGTVGVAAPVSFAMVVRHTGAFATTQARFISGGTPVVAPGTNGHYASAGVRLESGNKDTTWKVLVVVFDGVDSKLKLNDSEIVYGSTAGGTPPTMTRQCIGGQATSLSGVGLVGGISRIMMYDRALADSDINALSYKLMEEYGIS